MSLPSKGFRKIIIDKSIYQYKLTGSDCGIDFIIGLANANGQILKGYFSFHFCKTITPKIIKQVINFALKSNWKPNENLKVFELNNFEEHIECVLEEIICNVNNTRYNIELSKDINKMFAEIKNNRFNHIYITGYKSTLLVLTSKKKAYLMYSKEIDDMHYTALNLFENRELTVGFLTGSGQLKEYPIKQTVSIELAKKVMIAFYLTGEMWNGIDWLKVSNQ